MRVYISGPITGLDRAVATKAFKDAEELLAKNGHDPVNPMEIKNPDGCACDLGVDLHHTWSCCLRKDIRELITCDAILLLDGWQASLGARLEYHIATELGMHAWLCLADGSWMEGM